MINKSIHKNTIIKYKHIEIHEKNTKTSLKQKVQHKNKNKYKIVKHKPEKQKHEKQKHKK